MAATPAVGQHSLREQNIAVVAHQIFRATTPPSRADVSTATGLTRATVSALVDRLIKARIVSELPPAPLRRAGRPAVPLAPAHGTLVGIGLEVNVDYLSGTVVDLAGEVVASASIPGDFHHSDPVDVLERLADFTRDLLASAKLRVPDADHLRVAGVTVALPGLVDASTSTLRVAPNLGWADLSPVDLSAIARHTGTAPLTIGNEANLAALAQVVQPSDDAGDDDGGEPPMPRSFLYVSADVGIGAAIIVDGEPFLGGRGWSGELGHVVVDPHGPPCECGATGCLEQYAGKDALLRAAGLATTASTVDVLGSAGAGSVQAQDALERAGTALGSALADFMNLIDIPAVVLGGAYSDLADALEPFVREQLTSRVLSAPWSEFEIRRAVVGHGAAATGGARAVLREVVADPARWLVEASA